MSTEFWAGVIVSAILSLITGTFYAVFGGKLARIGDSWTEKRALDSRNKTRETILIEYVRAEFYRNNIPDFQLQLASTGILGLQHIAAIVFLFGQLFLFSCLILLNESLHIVSPIIFANIFLKLAFGALFILTLVGTTQLSISIVLRLYRMIGLIWRVRRFKSYKAKVAERLSKLDNRLYRK